MPSARCFSGWAKIGIWICAALATRFGFTGRRPPVSLSAPSRRSRRRSLDLRWSRLPCLDLTFEECPLMAIDGTSDPVVRLAIFDRQ
jgi:hypothetical protein